MSTITHTVQVDSRDRETSASSNNYVMHLTEPVKLIKNVIIRDIQVPNSTYNVVDGNNTFTVNVMGAPVILAPGSYSGLDLASHIFNVTTGQAGLDANWNVIYDTGSKKFIFTQTSAFTVTFGSSELADTMGFNNTTAYSSASYTEDYYVKDVTLHASFIPSDRVSNLVKDKYFYLAIEELSDPRVQTAKRSNSSGGFSGNNLSRIFGKVPVYSGPGSDIFFDRNGMFKLQREYMSPFTSLSRLSIKWMDYKGDLINFNGLDNNSFTLELVCENRIKTL